MRTRHCDSGQGLVFQPTETRDGVCFSVWAIVSGFYGLVDFEIARVPERGFVLALVGLIGKGLGPIGMAMQILSGNWPWSMGIMCLTNDLIWWIPFAVYLWDAWPHFKRTWKEEAP